MFKKNRILVSLLIIISLIITSLVIFKNNDANDVQVDNIHKNLSDFSINKLTKIRDELVDKNLNQLKKLGASEQELQHHKEGIITSKWGIVSFFNKNYSNLTEKEKLIRQIGLIEYLNSMKEVMDPAGEYFKVVNESYQISEYLVKNGRNYNYMSYENLDFLIDNLQGLSNFIDYDIKLAIEHIYSSIESVLPKNEKSSLNNKLKEVQNKN